MKAPRVSVVIATYGREEVLCNTLRQVTGEDYPNFEVIVVDQTVQHEAETERCLAELGGKIRYIKLPKPNLTGAENVGIREASGEIVLFLDDDVRFEPGLIAAHAANYEEADVVGVAGMVTHDDRPPTRRLPWICTFSKAGWFFFIHHYNRRVQVRAALGANMSFRREALLAVGGLDESLTENAVQWEIDLCSRVLARSGKMVHDPKARAHHLRAGRGGARMSRTLPRSFFANYIRVLWRHVPRHERWAILWRMLRDHVLIGSGGCPWTMAIMLKRMTSELVKVVRNGPGEAVPGSAGEGGGAGGD